MNRRDFLFTTSAALAFADSGWRGYEIETRVEVLKPEGATKIWLPAALMRPTPYQRTVWNHYSPGARIVETGADSLGIVVAEFAAGSRPVLTLTSRIETRDHAIDLSKPQKQSREDEKHFLRSTKLIPTDGIVKERSQQITKGAKTDLDKARAIYEWIVDNTFRDPKVRGCGLGNIKFMLESGDLGGKCADLNALYVGLARAAGLPARDVYGIRVAKSELGYKSLGTSSEVVTKSQHCRAEVYLEHFGWVPVDPADVRKVVLEEPPGNRPLDDDMVKKARARLFGSWEMNWMAYNFAHDVLLPGAKESIPFLMYPQSETGGRRVDSLDPDSFKYEIKSRVI
jgi:transglutaminase-like putative cysteine protease